MSELALHEFVTLFPKMNDSQFTELVESITRVGLIEPGVTFQGKILDGRHRAKACEKAGRVMEWEEFQGSEREALEYVVAKNLQRRDLKASERSAATGDALRMMALRKWDEKLQLSVPQPLKGGAKLAPSVKELAKMANVSTRTVKRTRRVQKASPELNKMVADGAVPLAAAEKIVTLSKAKMEQVIAAGPAAVKSTARDFSNVYSSAPATPRPPRLHPNHPNYVPPPAPAGNGALGTLKAALAPVEQAVKENATERQWKEYFAAKVRNRYEERKKAWNNLPPATPMQIIDEVLEAILS